jgi:hypothetical protein
MFRSENINPVGGEDKTGEPPLYSPSIRHIVISFSQAGIPQDTITKMGANRDEIDSLVWIP